MSTGGENGRGLRAVSTGGENGRGLRAVSTGGENKNIVMNKP